LSDAARRAALAHVGWSGVTLAPEAISLRPGMELTLNGIAQGYVADRIADFFTARGLDNILIDTGELRALGAQPGTHLPWPVRFAEGGTMPLARRALATSAPLGMTFGNDGVTGHILDPRTGNSTRPIWRSVSVSAPSAALADALSTAACLMSDSQAVYDFVHGFSDSSVENLV
jgi:thiamine biosynthesis lipoprotein